MGREMSLPPLIRPPSEAESLILQPTFGCSHNRCAFCETYRQRPFKARPLAEVIQEIDELGPPFEGVRKIFLGDGDPLVLPVERLLPILTHIRETWPSVRRITAYAAPRNFKNKTVSDLTRLRQAGLTQVYLGYESGDEAVLRMIDKGSGVDDIVSAGDKLNQAGIKISAIVILGVAGPALSLGHAERTARVVDRTAPRFLSALTLMCPRAYSRRIGHPDFRPLTPPEVLTECRHLLSGIEANGIIFRANHVSNYLMLEGVLQKSRARLLSEIDAAQERF
jgi:radical SAM superfamily enzyme YgiQ (UPF0313 family)